MAAYLGDFVEDATLHFLWSTNGADGASITRSTNGEVRVYKANGVGQSTAGVTDTEDFDGLTGVHACTIDLSADAFYAVANNYTVVLQGAVIDTKTVNAVLAHFSIENRFAEVDVTKWIGTACATPTVAGVPEVDLTHIGGAAQSGTDLKDFVDTGYDPVTHKVAGVVLTDLATATTSVTNTVNAAVTSIGNDVITAAAVHDAGAFVVGSLSITNQFDAGNVLVDTTTALTGELSVGNGVVVTCSTGGKSAAKLTGGAASGTGVEIIGTGTGQGVIATGGGTSGTGFAIVGGAPNGVGFYARGDGSGSGFRVDGGDGDGVGVVINGGATNGNAITIAKAGTGYDIDTDIHGTIDTTTNVTNAVASNVTQIGGVVQSATDLKDFVDTGYDPTSHKVAGVVLTDLATATTSVTNIVTANTTQISGDATAADNAELFFDGTGYAAANSTVGTVTTVTNAVAANVTQIGGVVQSAADLKDFVDTGYDPTSHKVAGVVLTDAATTINGIANNVITAAAIASEAIDADAIKADAVTEIQAGLALEATLTAMKGVGWAAQTLVSIQAAIAAIDVSGVADAVWDETMAGHVAPDSAGLVMRAIYALAIGRMKIDDVTKQLILYKADNVTEISRWDLFNSAGVPASTNIFDRQKV